ncbi:MAG TPA: hypothetical protein VFW33_20890 [Gemmataceae bacterium]|nr:hypothetical protein [Gemmataceae bacterium]
MASEDGDLLVGLADADRVAGEVRVGPGPGDHLVVCLVGRQRVHGNRAAVGGPAVAGGLTAAEQRAGGRLRTVGRQDHVGGVHPPVDAGHDRAAHDRGSEGRLVDRGRLATRPQLDVRVGARVGEQGEQVGAADDDVRRPVAGR